LAAVVADPLSRSDGPPTTEEFNELITGTERLFRSSAELPQSANFFEAVFRVPNENLRHL